MARKSKPQAALDLPAKVKAYFRAKAIGKKCYARADRLLEEISRELPPGGSVLLNESGKKAVLKDPFAGKFVAFRPLGFRRYELEIEE
jgi:hypothetical protein